MMRKAGVAGAALLTILALGGCDRHDAGGNNVAATAASADTLSDALGDASDLGTANRLIKSAGLEKMLGGVGAYTIFAPVDAAFAGLPDDRRKALDTAEGRPQLIALLRAHMVTGYVARSDLDQGLASNNGSAQLATVAGAPLSVRKQGDAILIGDGDSAARLVGSPIAARNGMIYRIDRVIPPAAK